MSVASYLTKIKLSGVTTVMTQQATSNTTALPLVYQIDSTARRIWDRGVSLTFFEQTGSSLEAAIPSSEIANVNRLFGKVTFNTSQSGSVSVSGNYFPVSNVAGANNYSLNINRVLLEDTDFATNGWVSRKENLLDVIGSISRWDTLNNDFYDLINSGVPAIVDIIPGGQSLAARGYFLIESDVKSGDVAALEASDISFSLDGSSLADFEFGVP